jgi:catechol 2,3-dioxygenase-like lactoylglutathione lyase family enzyme
MILELNHMSFTVSDLERSVGFYRDVLGLTVASLASRDREFSERVTGIPGAELRIAYMRAPNASVELIQYLAPPAEKLDTRTCNVGSAHVCFVVDDFENMVDRLRAGKVAFSGEPCIVPAGPNTGRGVLYFKDPDDNTIEIFSDRRIGVSPSGEASDVS